MLIFLEIQFRMKNENKKNLLKKRQDLFILHENFKKKTVIFSNYHWISK